MDWVLSQRLLRMTRSVLSGFDPISRIVIPAAVGRDPVSWYAIHEGSSMDWVLSQRPLRMTDSLSSQFARSR